MKKRTKIITGVVIAGILAAAAVPRFLKPAEVAEQVTIPVVKAETPQTGTITLSKEVIGTVEPIRHYLRNAESGGRVWIFT